MNNNNVITLLSFLKESQFALDEQYNMTLECKLMFINLIKKILAFFKFVHNKKLIHLSITLNNLGVNNFNDSNFNLILLNHELCQIDYTTILNLEKKKEKEKQNPNIIKICENNISDKKNKTGDVKDKLHELYNLNDSEYYSVKSDYWYYVSNY